MKVGVISDTHGFLDPRVAEIFCDVGHIVHAGDIGPYTLLTELEAIAPVTAVIGNTDIGLDLPLTRVAEVNGRKLLLHHIVDPLALRNDLKEEIARTRPDAVIFGHTHKQFYGQQHGVMYLNPGYSGRPKHGQQRSVAILHTEAKEPWVEFIDL